MPEDFIPQLMAVDKENVVAYQFEATKEEKDIERQLEKYFQTLRNSNDKVAIQTERFWGHTLYHVEDLDKDPKHKFQDTQSAFRRANGNTEIRDLLPTPRKNELPQAQEMDD